MAVNITTDTNTVRVLTTTNTVKVIDNRTNTTVRVTQPTTQVIKVATVGPQGQVGPQGIQGTTGIQGAIGIQGPAGSVSDLQEGIQGIQGTIGAQGTVGVQGTSGTQGTQGTVGIQGTEGTEGIQGVGGTQGTQGTQGNTGTQGVEGIQGITGIQGIQGNVGIQGAVGEGIQGPQGIEGIQGTTGAQGVAGSSGTSINTGSFATTGSNTFTDNQVIQGSVTASYYFGDGRYLNNTPATTNWNYNQEFEVKKTEQLTFSGDYILENTYLAIQGGVRNSIGEWEERLSTHGGSISLISNNQFEIVGPTATGGASDGNAITRYFDTETTMSVEYGWSGRDIGDDWPFYDIQNQYPYEYGVTNMLQDTGSNSETGTWTINIPSGSWVTFGVWTNSSNDIPGTLQITLPYIIGEDVEYSPNKFFKKEGKIFIGGNLLVKDSYIQNDGQINVGGQVILMGNSQIEGTGTII